MPDIDALQTVICWFEAQQNQNLSDDEMLLRAAKKLSDVPAETRQLGFQTFAGRRHVKQYEPNLAKGFFTKAGLEQRTHPAIATYKASHFHADDIVLEVGTGLGFDTAALAKQVKQVVSIEKDSVHAAFARQNIKEQGIANAEIICADFSQLNDLSAQWNHCTALYADPARRTAQGQRVKNVAEYSPSLEEVMQLAKRFRIAAIKVSPVYKATHEDFCSEWIGFDRECKERVLWQRDGQSQPDKVTIIDASGMSHTCLLENNEKPKEVIESELEDAIILFPHPALLASDRSELVAAERGYTAFPSGTKLYVAKEGFDKNVFFDGFKVLKVQSFDQKELVSTVRHLGWNANTELKKKNFPVEPESMRAKLNLPSYSAEHPNHGTVIFTQFNQRQIMIFAQRV